ncbi:MAG: hypothetical protein C4530_15360 [Desulfobacteraceae bacterium]|nr:MAG: hypothetical protein C4530_15360 [Desulfobacteraceae bacterium]
MEQNPAHGYCRLSFFDKRFFPYLILIPVVVGITVYILPDQKMLLSHYLRKQMLEEALSLISENRIDQIADSKYAVLAAEIYRKTGSPDQAIPVLEKLHRRDPENSVYLRELIRLYESTRDPGKQISALERNAGTGPSDLLSLKSLISAYGYRGEIEKQVGAIIRLIRLEEKLAPENRFPEIEDPGLIPKIVNDPMIEAVTRELIRLPKQNDRTGENWFLDELIRRLYTYRFNRIYEIENGGPSDLETAVIRLLEAYVGAGMLEEGTACAKGLDRKWNQGARNRLHLVRVLRWNRQRDEAVDLLAQVRLEFKHDSDILSEIAAIAADLGDIRTAIRAFEDIVGKEFLDPIHHDSIHSDPAKKRNKDSVSKDRANLAKIADLYLEAGSFEKAYRLYERLALNEGACGSGVSKMLQAAEYLKNRNFALRAASKVKQMCPENPGVLLAAAEMLQAAEAEKEAAFFYDEYLRRNPSDIDAAHRLADIYTWQAKPHRAYGVYKKLVGMGAGDSRVMEKMVQAAAEAGSPESLKEAVRLAVQDAPQDEKLHGRLAELLVSRELIPEAIEIYGDCLKRHPLDRNIRLNILERLYLFYQWTGNAGKACEVASMASEENPENFQMASSAAIAWMEAGMTANGIFYLERAAEIKPDHIQTRMHLARTYEQTGRVDEMILQLEDLEASGNLVRDGRMLLIDAYLDRKEGEKALRHLKSYAALSSLTFEESLKLARAYELSDRLPAAAGIYRELGEKNSEDAAVLSELGNRLLWIDDPDGAVGMFEKALRLDPLNPTALKGSGSVYADKNMPEKATRRLNAYIRLNPDDYLVQYRLGELYRSIDQESRAVAHYDRSLSLIRKALPVKPDLRISKHE